MKIYTRYRVLLITKYVFQAAEKKTKEYIFSEENTLFFLPSETKVFYLSILHSSPVPINEKNILWIVK